jgi:hypothetical protein
MKDNSQKYMLQVGLGFACIFALFFVFGITKTPEKIGLKVVKIPFLAEAEKPRFLGNVPLPKDTIPYVDFKVVSNVSDTLKYRPESKPKRSIILLPEVSADCHDSVFKKILLIGDSQLEGLRRPVYNFCVANNYDLVASVCWYGSSTKYWGGTDTLDHYLRKFRPDHVIFAIGLNELFVNDFDDRKGWIDNILNDFASYGVSYTWIGPAAWKEDKGIIDIMRDRVGPHFFSSEKLTLARAKDNMHPSNDAARVWMDSVAVFMRKTTDIDFRYKTQGDPKISYSPFILLQQPK